VPPPLLPPAAPLSPPCPPPIRSGSSLSREYVTNGASTGKTVATTAALPSGARRGPPPEREERRGAGRGGTRIRGVRGRTARRSHRGCVTRTTAFACFEPAAGLCRHARRRGQMSAQGGATH